MASRRNNTTFSCFTKLEKIFRSLPPTYEANKKFYRRPREDLIKQLCFFESLEGFPLFQKNVLFDKNLISLMLDFVPQVCRIQEIKTDEKLRELSWHRPIVLVYFATCDQFNAMKFLLSVQSQCQETFYFTQVERNSFQTQFFQIYESQFLQYRRFTAIEDAAKWIDDASRIIRTCLCGNCKYLV
jgi:hypothetical protein